MMAIELDDVVRGGEAQLRAKEMIEVREVQIVRHIHEAVYRSPWPSLEVVVPGTKVRTYILLASFHVQDVQYASDRTILAGCRSTFMRSPNISRRFARGRRLRT